MKRPGRQMRKMGVQLIICMAIFGVMYIGSGIDFWKISYYTDVVKTHLVQDYKIANIKEDAVSVFKNFVEKPKELYAALTDGNAGSDFIYPVDELAVAVFNQSGNDDELKYMSDEDIVVYSSASGMVAGISKTPENGGYTVTLKHDNGVETKYIGCTEVYIENLERVTRGQLIGCVSNSGIRNFAFELWENGEQKNPESYIEING